MGLTVRARTRGPRGAGTNVVIVTERLSLRHLTADDAPFILRLVNEPSWLEFIGDKGVRSLEDARADEHAMRCVVAIASPANRRSIELLGRLGMAFEAELDLAGDGEKTLLFALAL